jgi:predicted kinase
MGTNPTATAHLISGLPCSGKTTYAKARLADINRVHFALDYWLITAFGAYSIESVGHEEHVRRVLVCRELIWRNATSFLVRGVDVILDDGFFFRDNRKQYIKLASDMGAQAIIHYLSAPLDVLWARIERRNANLPPYNFQIERGMLEVFAGLFEIPSPEEGAPLVIVNGTDNPSHQIALF